MTSGPTRIKEGRNGDLFVVAPYGTNNEQVVCEIGNVANRYDRGNACLHAAALDLLDAAIALEKAETYHANCAECDGDGAPEACPRCFPLFDDARLKRRAAIDKATGQ